MGYLTTASGVQSTALGSDTTASGDQSTAMGRETSASGRRSTAMGSETTASGSKAPRWGKAQPPLAASTALGTLQQPLATTAPRWGQAQPPLATSTAMGHYAHAGSYGETSIGLALIRSAIYQASVLTDVLFEIGNGVPNNARSKAMTVLKNGLWDRDEHRDGNTTQASGSHQRILAMPALVTDGGSQILAMDSNEIHQFGHLLYLKGEEGVKIAVGDNADGDYSEVMHFTVLARSIGTDAPEQKLHVDGIVRAETAAGIIELSTPTGQAEK